VSDGAAVLAPWRESAPLFDKLTAEERVFLAEAGERLAFTHQERRQLIEMARDLQHWGAGSLGDYWPKEKPNARKILLRDLRLRIGQLRAGEKDFSDPPLLKPVKLSKELATTERKIHGMCPVASPETVCCNLRTIDTVENCGFGCSYCTIQTFYGKSVTFDANLPEKLRALSETLDPTRNYHYGTGQSSDSLMWGNQHGNLDDLCSFARENPNILLEFKTKSKNVSHFLKSEDLPRNLVCSWSLNPQAVIDSEEHFTASLDERLRAARAVADRGIGVSFHFHPMIVYDGWESDYPALVERVLAEFAPHEILFISMGSVTFIRPVIRAIRERERPTKMLQMDLVPTAKGKLSYPPDLKKQQFQTLYRSFAPWHDQVFFYLCMEQAEFWESTFGAYYPTNEDFEHALMSASRSKLGLS